MSHRFKKYIYLLVYMRSYWRWGIPVTFLPSKIPVCFSHVDSTNSICGISQHRSYSYKEFLTIPPPQKWMHLTKIISKATPYRSLFTANSLNPTLEETLLTKIVSLAAAAAFTWFYASVAENSGSALFRFWQHVNISFKWDFNTSREREKTHLNICDGSKPTLHHPKHHKTAFYPFG